MDNLLLWLPIILIEIILIDSQIAFDLIKHATDEKCD